MRESKIQPRKGTEAIIQGPDAREIDGRILQARQAQSAYLFDLMGSKFAALGKRF